MTESLNTIQQDNLIRMLQDLLKRMRVAETLILQIRTGFQALSYSALTTGATNMQFDANSTVKVTPNANASYTTTVPPAGSSVTLLILTSGTSSYTITFSTGFKSTGTLATGTVSSRVFAIQFVSDGTNLYEVSRTVAMVA